MATLVIVQVIWDDKVLNVDVNTKRKTSHLKQILVKEHGLDRGYKLFYRGRELDEKPLEEQGIVDSSEIQVVKPSGFATSGAGVQKGRQELDAMPQALQDLQTHLLENPEIMQQMMNSPAMQSLLNDMAFLESIMKLNPATRTSLETNPKFQEMMRDQDFTEQALVAFRNPSTMRDILSGTDKAVQELKSVPGGMDMITKMHSSLNIADEELVTKDGSQSETEEGEGKEAPAWHTALDPNAMASMMQDPNLQQLMAQFMETTERDHQCFADPAFISSLFRPENMQAIAAMETAMSAMGGKTKTSPASQFSKTFETFLEAQKENPEARYRTQLTKMRHTGFTNTAKCIEALEATQGNVQQAIERLLKQG